MVLASAKAPAESVLGLAELEKGKSLTVDAFERRIGQLKTVANHYKESEGLSGSTAIGILNVTSAMRRTENQFLLEYGKAATPEQKADLIVRYNSWLFNSFVGAYSHCWQDMLKRPDEVGTRDLRFAMDAAVKECEQVIASIDSRGIGLADSKGNGYGSRTLLQLVGASRMEEYKQGLRNVIKELKEAKELIGTAYNERAQLLMARASHDEDLLTASLMKDASSKATDMGIGMRRSQNNWLVNSWDFVTADHTWIVDATVLAISVIPTGVTQAAGAAYFTSKGLSDAAVGAAEGEWGKAGMGLLMAATPLAKFPKGLKLTTTGAEDARVLAKVAFGERTVAAATTTGRIAGSGMMLMASADTVRLIADADVYGWTKQDLEALAANGVFFGIGFVHGPLGNKLKEMREGPPSPRIRMNMLKPEPTATRSAPAVRALAYGNEKLALAYTNAVVLVDGDYLLGKHGAQSSQVGSKLGDVKTPQDLGRLLRESIDSRKLASGERIVVPNMDAGKVVGTDALSEILTLRQGGKEVLPGSLLQPNVHYEATVRDANGAFRKATVVYEETRAASPDGKTPAIMQPVAYVEGEMPATTKVNAVLIPVDLADARAAWLEPEALGRRLRRDSVDGKNAYAVVTVFGGEYAPAANGPASMQIDPVVGMTGAEFWSKHALMKSGKPPQGRAAEVPEILEEQAAATGTENIVPKKGTSGPVARQSGATEAAVEQRGFAQAGERGPRMAVLDKPGAEQVAKLAPTSLERVTEEEFQLLRSSGKLGEWFENRLVFLKERLESFGTMDEKGVNALVADAAALSPEMLDVYARMIGRVPSVPILRPVPGIKGTSVPLASVAGLKQFAIAESYLSTIESFCDRMIALNEQNGKPVVMLVPIRGGYPLTRVAQMILSERGKSNIVGRVTTVGSASDVAGEWATSAYGPKISALAKEYEGAGGANFAIFEEISGGGSVLSMGRLSNYLAKLSPASNADIFGIISFRHMEMDARKKAGANPSRYRPFADQFADGTSAFSSPIVQGQFEKTGSVPTGFLSWAPIETDFISLADGGHLGFIQQSGAVVKLAKNQSGRVRLFVKPMADLFTMDNRMLVQEKGPKLSGGNVMISRTGSFRSADVAAGCERYGADGKRLSDALISMRGTMSMEKLFSITGIPEEKLLVMVNGLQGQLKLNAPVHFPIESHSKLVTDSQQDMYAFVSALRFYRSNP